ncbi:hypothetical protein SynSYN20_02925 [Synechococcus sp. SYN20]|nr:hypothetical protein SynSYN20_02925 [Synechococcus sp. SYN20]
MHTVGGLISSHLVDEHPIFLFQPVLFEMRGLVGLKAMKLTL